MKRYVHGSFVYECQKCKSVHVMFLEKGIEEWCNTELEHTSGKPHKPSPFIIKCPDCNDGRMMHVGTNWFSGFVEAKKGMDIFMNVKSCDCGKPRFKWGGE